MSGVGRSRQRLTEVAFIVARSRWNKWNIGSSTIHLLIKNGSTLLTSCGNSLPKEVSLVRGNLFLWCNVSLMNLCARHWNDSITLDFCWGLVFYGLIGANEMIWFLMLFNGPLRKHVKSFGTPCRIMVGLSGDKLFWTWKKTPGIAYKDVLNEFDSIWGGGVKGLIMTWNNLVVRWKVRPQMGIVSWFPLALCWFPRGGCFLLFLLKLSFNLCTRKKKSCFYNDSQNHVTELKHFSSRSIAWQWDNKT